MEHELIPVYTKFTGNGVRVQNDSKTHRLSGRWVENHQRHGSEPTGIGQQ